MSSIAATTRHHSPGPLPTRTRFRALRHLELLSLGSNLWVSYAMQDAAKHDPVHQAGAGYIDIFTTDGVFVQRFATGGNLNAPWGMVLTPSTFGPLGNDYWIGNFGDGMINAFDAAGNSGWPTDRSRTASR